MEHGENPFSSVRRAGSTSPGEGPKGAGTRDFDPDALTRALRIAGAALVVASASTFMLQHWDGGDDIMRYGMLVGQSLLLAAAAYFVGLSLREGRSARTFLALVLATMPVSFAVLGGLVYSQFHWESAMAVPTYATWVAPSELAALLAVAGTLIVFVPLALVSFTALARRSARTLTLAFFAGNLAVLLPVRSPLVIVLLVAALVTALLRLELKRFAQQGQLDTLEGKLARGLLFAPPLLMLGRVFHLYHPGATFVGGVLLIAASASFQLLGRTQRPGLRDLGSWAVGISASLGWALCWPEVVAAFGDSRAAAILGLGLPISLLLAVAGQRAASARRSLLAAATFTAACTAVVACVAELDSLAAIGCIVVGVSIAVWGASVRALVRTLAGTVVALFGLGVQVWLATHADNVLRWASLSAVGMLLIVGSAYVERNRSRVARFWAEARARRELSRDAA